jgi:hypothetical protein
MIIVQAFLHWKDSLATFLVDMKFHGSLPHLELDMWCLDRCGWPNNITTLCLTSYAVLLFDLAFKVELSLAQTHALRLVQVKYYTRSWPDWVHIETLSLLSLVSWLSKPYNFHNVKFLEFRLGLTQPLQHRLVRRGLLQLINLYSYSVLISSNV